MPSSLFTRRITPLHRAEETGQCAAHSACPSPLTTVPRSLYVHRCAHLLGLPLPDLPLPPSAECRATSRRVPPRVC